MTELLKQVNAMISSKVVTLVKADTRWFNEPSKNSYYALLVAKTTFNFPTSLRLCSKIHKLKK